MTLREMHFYGVGRRKVERAALNGRIEQAHLTAALSRFVKKLPKLATLLVKDKPDISLDPNNGSEKLSLLAPFLANAWGAKRVVLDGKKKKKAKR